VTFEPITWDLRTRSLTTADHTLVMGVLNVTPDSFSDGGRWIEPATAIDRGRELAALGADVIDVGGESTRPGSDPVDAADELARVIPVVEALAAEGVIVSIDTSKPSIASAAIDAGAEIVNDVTGLSDPSMIELCSGSGVGVVIMHMLGDPRTMQVDPRYDDVIAAVGEFLRIRTEQAVAAGIDVSRIVVDPGIGFGKTFQHNLALLGGINLIGGERPVLIGTSRKGFLGVILDRAGRPSSAEDRDIATAATTAIAITGGASIVRVHDVAGAIDAGRTADAIVRVR
jgi:dihydropteroate synthase